MVVTVGTDDAVAVVMAWPARHPGIACPPRRITVGSGGHCYEDFVRGDDVRGDDVRGDDVRGDDVRGDDVSVITDVSAMDRVHYDAGMDACASRPARATRTSPPSSTAVTGSPRPAAPATPPAPAVHPLVPEDLCRLREAAASPDAQRPAGSWGPAGIAVLGRPMTGFVSGVVSAGTSPG
ncbi:hypothetical protein ABZ079_23885 [Streptomyces sp. NPDC006314]|uniref:hypothetical protein n=1 Tax=Streptomyces sp. NPDC006314 TaxID=3154475 RepID=UPI0033B70F0E